MKTLRSQILSLSMLLLVLLLPAGSRSQKPAWDPRELDESCVFEDDFARKTLYTWTTKAQIKTLRATKTLLSKSKSETKGYALFDVSLRADSIKDHPISQLLQSPEFAKKRFAWTNAWATAMGWEGESYGTQLIQIILKDSALIGKFRPHSKTELFAFSDLQGKKWEIEDVIKHKERIAAIYHVNAQPGIRTVGRSWGTYYDPEMETEEKHTAPFREYVIVNERMIASWNHGTPEIQAELAAEIRLLKGYIKSKAATFEIYDDRTSGWMNLRTSVNYYSLKYYSMQCFANDYYLFDHKRLRKIIHNLHAAARQQSSPLSN
jgi:hypothetical protein